MAANQTENYGLNQWLATDQVVRTDFNADNAKIDAALADLAEEVSGKAEASALAVKAEAEAVSALQTVVAAKAEQTALAALAERVTALEARPYIVTGTYTGDGSASRFISLGFTPKALLVFHRAGYTADPYIDYFYGGLALPDTPASIVSSGTTGLILSIEENGFRVYYNWDDGRRSNQEDIKFYYLAWR